MKWIYKIVPKYSILPIALMLLLNCITFIGTKFITDGNFTFIADGGTHYDLSTPLDDAIPFVSEFVIIYVLAYVQWVVGFIFLAKESKRVCFEVVSCEMIGKLFCLVIFLALPTLIIRPEVTGDGLFDWGMKVVFAVDTPTNLFPSLHCIESWLIFRTAPRVTRFGKWYSIANGILAVLVFASVVFVKQHLVLDIPSAIIITEISLFLGKKFKSYRAFEKLDRFIERKGANG